MSQIEVVKPSSARMGGPTKKQFISMGWWVLFQWPEINKKYNWGEQKLTFSSSFTPYVTGMNSHQLYEFPSIQKG